MEASMLDAFNNRQVRVVKFDVFTDQTNAYRLGGIFDHRDHALP